MLTTAGRGDCEHRAVNNAAQGPVVERQRLAGGLWLIAGLSIGLIAVFITEVPLLAVAVIGTIVGTALGLGLLVRPSSGLRRASIALGIPWLLVYGVVTILHSDTPPTEWLWGVWISGLGIAAAAVSSRRRSGSA